MRFHRRRVKTRRFVRPGRPPAVAEPQVDPIHTAPTEIGAPSVKAEISSTPPVKANDSTVQLPSVEAEIDPQAETESELGGGEPKPPARLAFACPCGTQLIATTATYDKHSRCAVCRAVLLVNLVFDPEAGTYEIVPFRIEGPSA